MSLKSKAGNAPTHHVYSAAEDTGTPPPAPAQASQAPLPKRGAAKHPAAKPAKTPRVSGGSAPTQEEISAAEKGVSLQLTSMSMIWRACYSDSKIGQLKPRGW